MGYQAGLPSSSYKRGNMVFQQSNIRVVQTRGYYFVLSIVLSSIIIIYMYNGITGWNGSMGIIVVVLYIRLNYWYQINK
jgi:hypothetical protein